MHVRTLALGGLAALALVVGTVTPAAARASGDTITLLCDSGKVVTAVVVGNGEWTPALFTDSNQVAVPIAFDGLSLIATDADTGAPLADFFDQTVITKNAQAKGRVTDHCVFSSSFVAYNDPDFSGANVRYTFSGGVTVTLKK